MLYAYALSGSRKIALFGNRNEVPKVTEFHSSSVDKEVADWKGAQAQPSGRAFVHFEKQELILLCGSIPKELQLKSSGVPARN